MQGGVFMAEIKSFKYGENIIVHQETKKVELENPIADISVDIIPTHITFSAVCVISDFYYKNSSIIGYNLKYKGDTSLKEEKKHLIQEEQFFCFIFTIQQCGVNKKY